MNDDQGATKAENRSAKAVCNTCKDGGWLDMRELNGSDDIIRCPDCKVHRAEPEHGERVGDADVVADCLTRIMAYCRSAEQGTVIRHIDELAHAAHRALRTETVRSSEPITLWANPPDQCESTSPDGKHSCTLIAKHWGVHVALDPMFGKPLEVWLSVRGKGVEK